MIVRAKYQSVCYRCAEAIRPGQFIDITRGGAWGGEVARHAGCQTEHEKAVAPFDPWEGRYVSPNGVTPPITETATARTRPTCQMCGKPVEWVRRGQKPLCDSCQEKARIAKLLLDLDAEAVNK